MTVATPINLAKYMGRQNIEHRLIITPLLDPETSIKASSIDIRLGTEFIIMKKHNFDRLDVRQKEILMRNIHKYQQKIRIDYMHSFIIHPNQLVIGSSFEYMQIPPDLMAYVSGKSTWGRMGLIIATAIKIDPGFKGCVTLEMVNSGEVPIVLYPGLPIAQLIFHKAQPGAKYEGVYECPTGPQFPKFDMASKYWEFWME